MYSVNNMNRVYIITFIFLLSLISLNTGVGQKVLRDTSVISDPCYEESMSVCEMLVPDTAYSRLIQSKIGRWSYGTSKYNVTCYYLVPGPDGRKRYSYKDFQLCIGEQCFEYSFPLYKYNLDRNYLIDNINTIYLKSNDQRFTRKLEQITIIVTGKVNYKNSKILDLNPLSIEDKKLIYSSSGLEIKVHDFSFDYEEPRNNCIDNIFRFPALDFNLYGTDKYPYWSKK